MRIRCWRYRTASVRFSFSEEENCVTVWLEKADSLTIARFKRDILDDDCLVFKQYDPNQPVIAE